MKLIHPGLCVLAATSLLVTACGGGDGNDKSDTGSRAAATATATPSTAPPSAGSASSLNLSAKGDTLAFDTDTLSAKAGKVTINFTNDSALSHNVVLIDSANKNLGETPVFDGGTKSFSATLKAGTYTYYCEVPGHRQAGMQGTLTVK